MYHIFFIHSSVDGPLGCFRVLATENRAAINIRAHVSFHIYVKVVTLSEIKHISYDITYMWNLEKKRVQMNLFAKQK